MMAFLLINFCALACKKPNAKTQRRKDRKGKSLCGFWKNQSLRPLRLRAFALKKIYAQKNRHHDDFWKNQSLRPSRLCAFALKKI